LGNGLKKIGAPRSSGKKCLDARPDIGALNINRPEIAEDDGDALILVRPDQ